MKCSFRFCSVVLSTVATIFLAACSPEGLDDKLGQASQPASQALTSELEPNGTPATASPIGTDAVVRANIFQAAADIDYFAFQAAAGDKVFAATMTAFSPSGGDTTMELVAPDGTTVIQSNLDGGSLTSLSSSIAGAPLTQTGTHYLRLLAGVTTIRPYDLHVKVQSSAPTAETEPNDIAPNPLPPSGYVSGALSGPMDYDFFSFPLQAGDTIFASLDLDPTRDGTDWNGDLWVGRFGPNNTSLVVGDAGGTAGPDSEAMFATAKNAGTYVVGVTAPSTAMAVGDYALSVAVHPATAATASCTTYTSTGSAQPIPADPGQVTSTLTVPGSPRIADIDVSLLLAHANPPDLDVYVTSPAGNTNVLVTDIGNTNYPNWDFTLDDEAAFPAGRFSLNHSLILQPELDYRLDWFDGENAGGTWTLTVVDDTAMNGGTLQGWSITVCEPPVVTCAGGITPFGVFSTNFESGASGFTHAGVQDEWALGTPSSAPITNCHSGTSCFKTDLTDTYNANSVQDLLSAPINLTGVGAPIQLSWAMKYQLDTASSDHAWVEVREVGGTNPRRVWEFTAGAMQASIGNPAVTLNESAGWGVHTADISAYAGRQIEVVFHLDSNAANQFAGLAVDDVAVTGCGCGNGTVEPGEQCDDGNTNSGDGCDNNCTPTGCGNGVITVNETCDDGNMMSGDGCDSNCTPTGCGNGILTSGEQCDDGNAINDDGCDSNCTATGCGNGILTSGEQCDDGNTTSGDGCDSNCMTEGGGGAGGGSSTGTTGSTSSATGSSTGSATGTSSGSAAGSGGAGGSSGSAGTGGAGASGGSTATSSGSTIPGDGSDLVGAEGGCGCSVPGQTPSNESFAALGLLGLLAARLRRSRK